MNFRFDLLLAGLVAMLATSTAFADTAEEKFWTNYIEACNPSSQLNGKAKFLGTTNIVGPGSVWGTASGTTNLIAPASYYLGHPGADGKEPTVQYATSTANCSGKGSRVWDVGLGLPVSMVGNSAAADLALALKNAKSITVTIQAVQVDSVPIALWQDAAARNVSHSSSVYTMAVDGSHYVMAAAVAVSGLTITYTLDTSLVASLQGQIKANNLVNIGTADKPVNASVNVGTNGQTITLTATDRTYVLGQLLKINKVKQKDLDLEFVAPAFGTPPVREPKQNSFPKVRAKAAVEAGTA